MTQETKHTPKWVVKGCWDSHGNDYYTVNQREDKSLDEIQDIARLIASAPELLDFAQLVAAGHLTHAGFVDAANRVLERTGLAKAGAA